MLIVYPAEHVCSGRITVCLQYLLPVVAQQRAQWDQNDVEEDEMSYLVVVDDVAATVLKIVAYLHIQPVENIYVFIYYSFRGYIGFATDEVAEEEEHEDEGGK